MALSDLQRRRKIVLLIGEAIMDTAVIDEDGYINIGCTIERLGEGVVMALEQDGYGIVDLAGMSKK